MYLRTDSSFSATLIPNSASAYHQLSKQIAIHVAHSRMANTLVHAGMYALFLLK